MLVASGTAVGGLAAVIAKAPSNAKGEAAADQHQSKPSEDHAGKSTGPRE
jgi:hypothetical protein